MEKNKTLPFALVSVIVPVYNEADSIEELFLGVKTVFEQLSLPFEFIAIDDGSNDNSFQTLRALWEKNPSNVTVIRHFRNCGKSMALMQGFDAAKGDVAISMDADLQDIPEMIPRFLEKLREGYDLVNGWRINRRDSTLKKVISKVYSCFVSALFNCNLHDINCGFKGYSRFFFKTLELNGEMHRLIPAIASLRGLRVAEIAIDHKKREHGISKFSLFRYRGLLDVIALAFSDTHRLRPFHLACEAAFVLWVLGGAFFFGWYLMRQQEAWFLLRFLMVFSGAWLVLVGTILPFIGLILDTESARIQNPERRKIFVSQKLSAEPQKEPNPKS